MKVAAVSTVRNEADIIAATLGHLYAEGVAEVYIADGRSTDGTRDILAQFPCKVFDDDSPIHRQPYWMERLVLQASEEGADWILCVDADEFWYATSGVTIPEALAEVDATIIGKLYAKMWQHLDYEMREPQPKSLHKVAVRSGVGIQIANGNHDAVIAGGSLHDILSIREIQFRGFEHFCRKIQERCATLDPALPPGEGAHITQFKGWTKEQLAPIWQAHVDRATVNDPIPLRTPCTQA
jgi:glycosyltransferase involved in cell wall biosynthesis